MHSSHPSPFYAAALSTLRFVEHRAPTGRRFGADADARWKAFHGHLTTADRIDLLLRDADVEFPGAFGARTTFALRAVAEDEPFGAEWTKLPDPDSEALWRRVVRDGSAPADLRAALAAVAEAWGLPLKPPPAPAITPTTRLLVVGPSAVVAAVEGFARGTDLAWADQVVVIATPPGHRQLAASGAALLRATKPTQIRLAANAAGGRFDLLFESSDADPSDLAAARAAHQPS